MRNGNGKKDRLDRIEEMLQMAAVQTAENAKQLGEMRQEFRAEMREMRAERRRDRAEVKKDMQEIRALFKQMIRRIAV
jgi:soluble cytochrome b562